MFSCTCMTEPHFSERSAYLESHLRPKIALLLGLSPLISTCPTSARSIRTQDILASLRYGLGGPFSQGNGFWSPRFSGDRPRSFFSRFSFLFFFFHHHDE